MHGAPAFWRGVRAKYLPPCSLHVWPAKLQRNNGGSPESPGQAPLTTFFTFGQHSKPDEQKLRFPTW